MDLPLALEFVIMKLYNESLAGQKLVTDKGEIVVAEDGSIEVEDKDLLPVLKISGFKPKKFSKGEAPVKEPVKEVPKPEVAKDEPKPEPKPEPKQDKKEEKGKHPGKK